MIASSYRPVSGVQRIAGPSFPKTYYFNIQRFGCLCDGVDIDRDHQPPARLRIFREQEKGGPGYNNS